MFTETWEQKNKRFNEFKKIKEQQNKEILIEDLDLSVRQYNCLKREGINTNKELIQYTKEELLKIRNLNERNIDDLIEKGYVKKHK